MTQDSDDAERAGEQAFRAGLEAGLAGKEEPRRKSGAADPDGETTTLRSRWLHRRCPVCGHSFRPGDRVRSTASGETVHAMPGLCQSGDGDAATVGRRDEAQRDAFFTGLERACPLPTDVPVRRLAEGHPLLAPPAPGLPRHACRVCGHTFRPGELVVVCPCQPDEPRCRAAVHRDHVNQLWCWDEWQRANPEGTERPCLAMS